MFARWLYLLVARLICSVTTHRDVPEGAVLRCTRCERTVPVDAPRCQTCGAVLSRAEIPPDGGPGLCEICWETKTW